MENKKIFHQIASILTELIPIRLEALKQISIIGKAMVTLNTIAENVIDRIEEGSNN